MKAGERTAKKCRSYDEMEHAKDADAERRFRSPAYQRGDGIPKHVKDVYEKLQAVASLCGFEIVALKDKKTGREYRQKITTDDIKKILNNLEMREGGDGLGETQAGK